MSEAPADLDTTDQRVISTDTVDKEWLLQNTYQLLSMLVLNRLHLDVLG